MNLIIFDLDGTLVDSKQDLINSVNATRKHMGMGALPDDTVASYVGRGAPALIKSALGPEATEGDVLRGLEYFLLYYREHMLDCTVLYEGVREALDMLKKALKPMAILTNKPVRFSTEMIARLGLSEHFFRIYGGNSFATKKPDPVGIHKLMEEAGMSLSQTLMVGDSAVDVKTARNAGVPCCGVSYGFQPETFEAHPPDFVVDSMTELADMLLEPATNALL